MLFALAGIILSHNGNASHFRRRADELISAGQFQAGSEAFSKAAELYANLGDSNAAKVLRGEAKRYITEIKIFEQVPFNSSVVKRVLAKHEPPNGCLLGVNIDREDVIEKAEMMESQIHRDPQYFSNLIGKPHAMYFMYRDYGKNFPREWARRLKERKASLQLAYQPRNIEQVKDDLYLRDFARDANDSGIPIFLRFAIEMNGDWTARRYGSDPVAYIRAWKIVHRVMAEEAPNVAMVWCPNEIPEDKIDRYYPGPAYVDWVGVNFYSVIYDDANRARGAEWRNPIDALSYIYFKYAPSHPMMIGEWAATHRSVLDSVDRPDFARQKIGQLYGALPLLFPRIKAVNWLSMNTMVHAQPGRRLNNYSLLANKSVAEKYSSMVEDEYFLAEPSKIARDRFVLLGSSLSLNSNSSVPLTLGIFVRSYENSPQVRVTHNKVLKQQFNEPSHYRVRLAKLKKGDNITVTVSDGKGRVALSKTIVVK